VDKPIHKTKEFLKDLLFPKFCLGCKKEGVFLCQDCRSLLDISEFDYCLCDQKPIRLPPESKSGKCQRCQNKKLSGLYFALSYKENSLTKKLIRQFKYQPYIKELSKTLASILIEHFLLSKKNTDEIWQNSILIPVPLDNKKLKTRGYNQSEEINKELSKILKIEESDIFSFLRKTGFEVQYGGNTFGDIDNHTLIIGDNLQYLEDGEFVEYEDRPIEDFKLLEKFEKVGIVGTLKTYVKMISNDNY